MDGFYKNLKYTVYITQLGLEFMMPMIILTYVGRYLSDKFHLNNMVVIIFMLVGVFVGGHTVLKRLKHMFSGEDKEDNEKKV